MDVLISFSFVTSCILIIRFYRSDVSVSTKIIAWLATFHFADIRLNKLPISVHVPQAVDKITEGVQGMVIMAEVTRRYKHNV